MSIKQQIEELITGPLEKEGFELIELKLARYKKNSRVQLFVDSDHGVSIDDCVRLSRIVEPILEQNEVFTYGYTVEVSSPGLDRPLETARDFKRRIGEKIQLYFHDSSIPPKEGELVGADEQFIELENDLGRNKYDLVGIKMGKIIF